MFGFIFKIKRRRKERKLCSFERFEVLTVSIMMKVMALAISGLSGNKVFISLVITFLSYFFYPFFIDLSGLMSAKVICNTCNKSVSCKNLIEFSLFLAMVHLKCNNLNFDYAETIKKYWLR